MKITLYMLLREFLQSHPEISHTEIPEDNTAVINGIRLMPQQQTDLKKKYLYLCSCLPAFAFDAAAADIRILCLSSTPKDTILPDHTVLFFTVLELPQVCNELQEIFESYRLWETQMESALFQDKPLQDFVDSSAPFIRNPLLIYDPALKVLAFSKEYADTNDMHFRFAAENGYMDPEAVHYFESMDSFEILNEHRRFFSARDDFLEHNSFINALIADGILCAYIVVVQTNTGDTVFLNHLFEIFFEYMVRYFENRQSVLLQNRDIADYFMTELLENPQMDPQIIQSRLEHIELPFEENFLLVSIRPELSRRTAEAFFVQTLRTNLPDCHIFPYNGQFLVLFFLPAAVLADYRTYIKQRFQTLKRELAAHRAVLFAGCPFFTLDQLPFAFRQTQICAHLSERTPDTNLFCFYDDHVIESIFARSDENSLFFDYCHPALKAMLAKNQKKTPYRLQILKTYLQNDRKLLAAAEQLHMHRNNVSYHIRQLEQEYRLDLEDYNTRFQLLFSFELLEYLGVL